MEEIPLTELSMIRELILTASLTDEVRKSVGWCQDRLPALYGDFSRTCEFRFGSEIRRLVEAMLMQLDEATARATVDHLRTMHERLGIPNLNFVQPKQRKRKAG